MYHFKCITCKTDCYVGRKGNDLGGMDRKVTCETCRKGQKRLPESGTTKNTFWTFQGMITGDEKARIRKEWGNEIEAYEAGKKAKDRNMRMKRKKKNNKK